MLFKKTDRKVQTAEMILTIKQEDDYSHMILQYRKKNHYTQQELASRMGISEFTLRSWEQKKATPPYILWRRYRKLFEDSANSL